MRSSDQTGQMIGPPDRRPAFLPEAMVAASESASQDRPAVPRLELSREAMAVRRLPGVAA